MTKEKLGLFAILVSAGCALIAPEEPEPERSKIIVITDDYSESTGATNDPTGTSVTKRVEEAVADYNLSRQAVRDALCSCDDVLRDFDDEADCRAHALPDLGLSECGRTAAACDVDSYTAYYACIARSQNDWAACWVGCPGSQDVASGCNSTYEAAEENCSSLVSPVLYHASVQCNEGAAQPTCELPSQPEQCEDYFRQFIASDDRYWRKMFNIENDDTVDDGCHCYSNCIVHSLDFKTDGSYWQNWAQSTPCDYYSSTSGACDTGTWEVFDCNKLRMTNCRGQVTLGTMNVVDGRLVIDATWSVDNNVRRFTQEYKSYSRVDGEAWGLRRQDCGVILCR